MVCFMVTLGGGGTLTIYRDLRPLAGGMEQLVEEVEVGGE